MLGHNRNDHGRVFRSLGFVDARGICRNEIVELTEPIRYRPALEIRGQYALLGINREHITDIAVVYVLVVVVFDLHHLVVGRKGPAKAFDTRLPHRIQRGLQRNG